jgi:2-haloacid dehalogenase
MISKEIKGIFFDAHGTLFDVGSIHSALEQLCGNQAPAVAELWRRKQLEYSWLRTIMGRYVDFYELTKDALRYALQAVGLELSRADKQALMQEYYRLKAFPEVPEALARLKARFHLAILSNANPSMLERAVSFNNLEDLFDDIISADELQVYKPNPAIYQLPVKKLGQASWNLLFVSSNTWDVAGATACGLQVAWVKRGEAVPEQLGLLPDTTVGSLTELTDLLMGGGVVSSRR